MAREVCDDVLRSCADVVDAALEALLPLAPAGYMPPSHTPPPVNPNPKPNPSPSPNPNPKG